MILDICTIKKKSLDPIQFRVPPYNTGPPRQPRMPRIGPCQVLAATLPYLNQGEQTMPTQYWGPWLAKIRRGGPVKQILIQN